jgi:DNA-binding CsgD family transcriptional regulator
MKSEPTAMVLTKKLDRCLLALQAAQTPIHLSEAAYGCAQSLVCAQRALIVFSPGEGLPPKLHHFTGESGSENWLQGSWSHDPLIRHLYERQSSGPLHLSRIFTSSELARSPFAAKWLQDPNFPHIAAMSSVVRESSSVLIFLFRDAAIGDYTSGTLEQLDWFYGHFKIAWLRVFVREETLAIHHSLQDFLRQSPNGLAVLNWDLGVVYRNVEAAEACAHWNFGPDGARKVQPSTVFRCPDEVIAVCQQLKSAFQQGRELPAADTPESADGASAGSSLVGECASPGPCGTRAIVRLVALKSSALEKPVFQIRFVRRAPADQHDPTPGRPHRPGQLPAQFSSLTLREREVVDCICRGLSNEAIAQQLSKSVPTVKNQLHSIFQKLSVSSRAALMALIQSETAKSQPTGKRS